MKIKLLQKQKAGRMCLNDEEGTILYRRKENQHELSIKKKPWFL